MKNNLKFSEDFFCRSVVLFRDDLQFMNEITELLQRDLP